MSKIDLGGFDVVVHLAESVINRGLELIPSGSTFPVDIRKTITLTPSVGAASVPILYDALVELQRPQITLDQANNKVVLRCELSPASELTFLQVVNASQLSLLTNIVQQIALTGTLELSCPFDTVSNITTVLGNQVLSGAAAVAKAGGVSATLSLVIPSANGANVPLASAAVGGALVTVSTATITSILQSAIGTGAGDAIGTLPLTNPVRLNTGTSRPQRVHSILAQISPVGSPSAISLGVLTDLDPASPGGSSVPAPPADLVDGALGVANYWTLQLLCTAMAQANPGIDFQFDSSIPRATFNGSVVIPGGQQPLSLKDLTITASSTGVIDVSGHATASGECWDAKLDFDFGFSFMCDPQSGSIVAKASQPIVTPHINKDLLCEILGAIAGIVAGIITGGLIGGIIGGTLLSLPGAIVGGIIGGIVGGIAGFIAAGALIDPFGIDGVNLDTLSVLGGLTLPLPLGAAGFIVDACDFDDLEVRGRFAYVDFAERHRAGVVSLLIGQGVDLDTGVVRSALDGHTDDPADLYWSGAALSTVTGAVLGTVFAAPSAFDTTSLTELEQLSYAAGAVSGSLLTPRSSVAFAVRTDEGRYAKCRVHRELTGAISLEYIVYEQPHPCMGTNLTIDTVSKKVVHHGNVVCTTSRREPPSAPPIHVFPVQPAVTTSTAVMARSVVVPVNQLPTAILIPQKLDDCGGNTTVEHEEVAWQIVDRARRLVLRALPRGAAAPLVYRWNVLGTELSGAGTATVAGVDVTYNENSPILTMHAPEGVDVAGSVVITAMDADGRTLSATRAVMSPSRKRLGGCCDETHAKLTLKDAAEVLDQARVAQRVFDAGIARLQRIAAAGVVKDAAPLTVADAVKRLR